MAQTLSKGRVMAFVCGVIFLDAVGFGLLMPLMPALLDEVAGLSLSEGAAIAGLLLSTFAVMQFLFAPVLGGLSDRFGRRPILLLALLGFAIDSFIMAWAPTLTWLFAARIISGICGATYAAANACIVDISDHDERAKFFGYGGAALGLGFIFGPALGGFLGEYWVRLPFIVAGVLIFAVIIYGYFAFPETLKEENRRPFSLWRANPLGSLISIGRFPTVLIVLFAMFCVQLANHSYSSIWAFYATAVAGWSLFFIGVSVSVYGLIFAGVQGALTGPVVGRIGEVKTIYLALLVGMVAFIILTFAQTGWHIYTAIIAGGLSALLGPSLQSLMTKRTPADSQGELQGAITSLYSIAAIASPPMMAWIFASHTDTPGMYLPGAPFLLALLLLVFCALAITIAARRMKTEPEPMDQSGQDQIATFD